MDLQALSALEHAIEPYRRAGFVVTSQSEGAITLEAPPEKFSYILFFFILIVFWPIAVIYLVSFNNRKARTVCVRMTSQGNVEETGYTLDVMAKEGKRGWRLLFIAISILVLLALALWLRFYLW